MDNVRHGDGVIAKRANGKREFGNIDGRFGNKHGVTFKDRTHEFIAPNDITPLYSIPQDFDVLFDNNLYHYPCKFSDYNWQLQVREARRLHTQ